MGWGQAIRVFPAGLQLLLTGECECWGYRWMEMGKAAIPMGICVGWARGGPDWA